MLRAERNEGDVTVRLQRVGEAIRVAIPATDEIQLAREVGGKDDRDSHVRKTLHGSVTSPLAGEVAGEAGGWGPGARLIRRRRSGRCAGRPSKAWVTPRARIQPHGFRRTRPAGSPAAAWWS